MCNIYSFLSTDYCRLRTRFVWVALAPIDTQLERRNDKRIRKADRFQRALAFTDNRRYIYIGFWWDREVSLFV